MIKCVKNIEASKLVEWLQLISGEREMVEMALSKNAQKIEKAYKELQYLSQDKAAREEFDAYQRLKIDEKMKIDYAEERGIQKGREEARKEKIEMVKEMQKLNISIDIIMQTTKFTKEEIEKIKQSL
jgi:predicted transposase/invertase (TIGR01784 family)